MTETERTSQEIRETAAALGNVMLLKVLLAAGALGYVLVFLLVPAALIAGHPGTAAVSAAVGVALILILTRIRRPGPPLWLGLGLITLAWLCDLVFVVAAALAAICWVGWALGGIMTEGTELALLGAPAAALGTVALRMVLKQVARSFGLPFPRFGCPRLELIAHFWAVLFPGGPRGWR